MESRPPQEPPRRPSASGRKPNGSGGSPTPPWIWVFLIAVVGLITYVLSGKNETTVNVSPWFMEQVHDDNIEYLMIEDLTLHGRLRRETTFAQPEPLPPIKDVKRFTATVLTENQLDEIRKELESPVSKDPAPGSRRRRNPSGSKEWPVRGRPGLSGSRSWSRRSGSSSWST